MVLAEADDNPQWWVLLPLVIITLGASGAAPSVRVNLTIAES